jgi:prolyl 4-hydroxylase
LNKLFEEWATSEDYAKYEPQIWSSPDGNSYGKGSSTIKGPWVITFDNFLTEEEAEALIRGGSLVGFDRSTDQGAVNEAGEMEKIVSQTRTSSNAWCTGACERLPEVQAVTTRIEQVTHIPKSHYESFQILEYNPNQFYRSHHDSSNRKDDSPAGHRILTFFLYLSDVEEGGETFFNKLGIAVKPKLGRALVWPSVLNETPDMWDARMFHEAKDVIKGKKYAANHWIHLNDYVTPNTWGCTGSFSVSGTHCKVFGCCCCFNHLISWLTRICATTLLVMVATGRCTKCTPVAMA